MATASGRTPNEPPDPIDAERWDPAAAARNTRYWPFAREFAKALTEDLRGVGNIAGHARPGLVYHFLTVYEHQFAEALSLLTVAISDDYRTGKLSNDVAIKILQFIDANQLRVR